MAPMMCPAIDIKSEDNDYEFAAKMIAIWRRAVDTILSGDYYPLTAFSKSTEKWLVRQFDSPETEKGVIQGFRHSQCKEGSITVWPKCFIKDACYLFENDETGEKMEISGEDIQQNGFTMRLPLRSAVMWFYRIKR